MVGLLMVIGWVHVVLVDMSASIAIEVENLGGMTWFLFR